MNNLVIDIFPPSLPKDLLESTVGIQERLSMAWILESRRQVWFLAKPFFVCGCMEVDEVGVSAVSPRHSKPTYRNARLFVVPDQRIFGWIMDEWGTAIENVYVDVIFVNAKSFVLEMRNLVSQAGLP